jgi:hypothetical protein
MQHEMRSIKIREPIPMRLFDAAFEANLLFVLLTDDSPAPVATRADSTLLGTDEFYGDGHVMFGGDREGLIAFNEFAKTSSGKCAKIISEAIDIELQKPKLDDAGFTLDFGAIPTQNGPVRIGVEMILQDLLIQHGEAFEKDYFTISGFHIEPSTVEKLGGYGFFITREDIAHVTTNDWIEQQIAQHQQMPRPGR